MTTKKQARDQARRQQAKHEARLAAKRAQTEKRIRIGAVIVGAAVAIAIITTVIILVTKDDAAANGAVSSAATAPDASLAEGRTWSATIATNLGDIEVTLDGANAPQATASFVALAQEGFFDGTQCHRLVTEGIYVLQCGDPTGTGTGGPDYQFGPIENAPGDDVYRAGTLAMARVGNDAESMGSQFFIVYEDSTIPSDSVGGYTVFGQVTQGLSIVDDVARAGTQTGEPDGNPAQSVILNEVSVS